MSAAGIRSGFAAILTAGGSQVWIINRTYSGIATAANYMEQPTLSQTSGAVTAMITNPTHRDMLAEPGHYTQDDRMFHIASGAIANQFDYISIPTTGDTYVITDHPNWYWGGQEVFTRITGRRIKVN